ncbi:S8 family serine peptidase, partial [candidate division KSB1 bacterium]
DSGIDWRHDDFLTPDGATRIKYILDLSETGPVYGGTVYTEDQINAGLAGFGSIDQVDISGHGTHVAGIAVSDGASDYGYGDYAGIAPEADIVIVKATRDRQGSEFYSTDQILALAFIDSVAHILGKPWVANLSLGGHSGAHDGTSPVERYIDKITGPGIPGKAVVTVAGNDGDRDVHAKISISPGNDEPAISFEIESFTPNVGPSNDVVEMTGWYDGARKIGITLIAPSGNRYGPVLPSQVFPGNSSHPSADGSIYIWNGFYFTDSGEDGQPGANPYNGDREFYISISDDDQSVRPAAGEWRIEFSGTGGLIDMWLANSTMDAYFVLGKVDDGKLTIPGTARHSITVGSFISKKSWQDLDGNRLTFDSQGDLAAGQLSPFSSPGPVRKADYQKPDMAAPGQIIASTFSANSPPTNSYSIFQSGDPNLPHALINSDGYHALSSGTSFAAPHVAGAVALILEQNAELSVVQIKDILQRAADTDQWVGDAPNISWGWGKLNVFKALLIDPEEEPPTLLRLYPAAPNPFMGRTRITFDLPLLENIPSTRIVIYNALGRKVCTLVDEVKNSGSHTVYWNGCDEGGKAVGKGVYFIRLTFGANEITKKALFLGIEK